MNESEARELAREINQDSDWSAWPERQPFIGSKEWWVQTYYPSMDRKQRLTNPFPVLPIPSREEWEKARNRWGK